MKPAPPVTRARMKSGMVGGLAACELPARPRRGASHARTARCRGRARREVPRVPARSGRWARRVDPVAARALWTPSCPTSRWTRARCSTSSCEHAEPESRRWARRATSASSSAGRCPAAHRGGLDGHAPGTRPRAREPYARGGGDRGRSPAHGCSTCSGCRRDASFAFVTGCQMAHVTALAAARHRVLGGRGLGRRARRPDRRPARARAGRRGATRDRRPGAALPRARHRVHASRSGRRATARCDADALADRLATGERPDDRVRAGRQRQHRRGRPARRDLRRGARGRRMGSRGRRVRAVGRARARGTAQLLRGCERADSWATDAHKWLNVPYDCGIAIVADTRRAPARDGGAGELPPAGRGRARADGLDARVLAPGAGAAGLRGAALARAQRRGGAGRAAVRLRRALRGAARRASPAWRWSPGASTRCSYGRRETPSSWTGRARDPARGHVLGERHHLARRALHSHLGLQLADDASRTWTARSSRCSRRSGNAARERTPG